MDQVNTFTFSTDSKTVWPMAAGSHADRDEYAICERFMRHIRYVPHNRMEIRVLSSIQFTADMLDCSDAHVAKVLVDLGLRAPRLAFPVDFLRFADQALMRTGWDVGGPTPALKALKAHWDCIGESKFAAFCGGFDLLEVQRVF